MKIIGTTVLALILHLTLGWMWTALAGVAGGFWAVRRGWLVGGAGVSFAWGVLLAYALVAHPEATRRMAGAVGGILGNLPGFAVVVASLLIGTLLGALGGWTGAQAAQLLRGARRT